MNIELLAAMRSMDEAQLYQELYRDPLTGAMNRRAFDLDDSPAVAVVDLDSLKYVNDNFGHRAGDRQLQDLAHSLALVFDSDRVYRIGGDEFAITGESLNDIRQKLEALRRILPTFSYGADTTLERADDRLNEDKHARELKNLRASRGEQPWWINRLKTA